MNGESSIPAGWYHMEGDPAGTYRWWDGSNWTVEVQPLQPAAQQSTTTEIPVGVEGSGVETKLHKSVSPVSAAESWANWDQIYAGTEGGKAEAKLVAAQQMSVDAAVDPGFNPLKWMLLPYLNYANFKARSCRAEFWWFQLFLIMGTMLFFSIGTIASIVLVGEPEQGTGAETDGALWAFAPLFLFFIGSAIPAVALQVRRLHDTDRSGWPLIGIPVLSFAAALIPIIFGADAVSIYLLVIALASLYSLFISVMMWFIPGEGWNKYGATHLLPKR